MQVKAIKVSAGRTFNHPFEQYSNLRCDVHLDAQLDEGDDPKAAMQALQAQAEELCENHKQDLIKQIHNLERLTRSNEEITRLEERISEAQRSLDRVKETRNALTVKTPSYSYPANAVEDDEDNPGF